MKDAKKVMISIGFLAFFGVSEAQQTSEECTELAKEFSTDADKMTFDDLNDLRRCISKMIRDKIDEPDQPPPTPPTAVPDVTDIFE